MQTPSLRTTTYAAVTAALGFVLSAVIQLADAQSSESTIVGIEHLAVAGFTVYCIALAPVSVYLGRLAGHPLPGLVAGAGQLVLGLLAIVSNVRGTDPSFFAAIAAPCNLAWLAGTVALAVVLYGSAKLPRAFALLLPVTYLAAIPLAPLGGGLLAAGYWLALAHRLHGAPAPRVASVPAVA